MEQSDRPKREPIPITPTSRKVQDNEASVAAFLDYMEALYKSLENCLEKIEGYKQSYEKMTRGERSGLTVPTEIVVSFAQYEGHYSCRGREFLYGMGILISLLYTVMRKGSQVKHETKPLTDEQCYFLFNCIGISAGFHVTLVANFVDNWVDTHERDDAGGFKKEYFSALDSFARLIDFNRPLREQDWDTFRTEAKKRVPIFVHNFHTSRYHDKLFPYDAHSLDDMTSHFGGRGYFHFSHHRSPTSKELNEVVSEIIDGEVLRFRRFIEAFHGTLRFLADAKPLAQMNIKPPVFDWNKRNEALDIFQETIDLVRTVANKQEVTPQKSATTLKVSKVTSPTKVTLQVRKEEHKGDLHTYHLTLTDSKHLSEPVLFFLQVSESGEAELFEDDSNG